MSDPLPARDGETRDPLLSPDGVRAAWAVVDRHHGPYRRVPMVELLTAYLNAASADPLLRPPARDGETLSDEHFTDEHIRAIETACEKLWNGIPAENPIHGPRPHDHPLYVIASAAHLALNAACAEIAALRTKLADARVDAERLDWMAWVCAEADAAAMLPTLREAIDAARAASGEDDRR